MRVAVVAEYYPRAADSALGVWAHRQALAARDAGADYLGVGPIFATATKPDAGAATGTGLITAIKGHVDLPLVGIGGINRDNAAAVLAAGADGVAVVSAVVAADDSEAAARELKGRMAAARPAGTVRDR